MLWKFEAIVVYKQAEKALTSISYLLFFFFLLDQILHQP